MRAWRQKDPARYRESVRLYRLALRQEVITALGGQCACCGETNLRFLSLDHINGGGTKHNRLKNGNLGVYRQVREEGYPRDKYQVLCFNCNMGRAHNNGVCPHKEVAL